MSTKTRLKILALGIWTCFQNPLANTYFNMFVRTSANESCVTVLVSMNPIVNAFQTVHEPRFAIGLHQRVNLLDNIWRILR